MRSNTLVAAFMRANPPHRGHMIFIDHLIELAKNLGGVPVVFLSQSQDNKQNPIPYDIRLEMMSRWTNGIVLDSKLKIKQPGNILHYANACGYDKIVLLCGDDRYAKYAKSFVNFAKSRSYFNFKSVDVVCHWRYDEVYLEAAGMSGTKMREFVKNNDFKSFSHFLPFESHFNGDDAQDLWDICQKSLNTASNQLT